jgi:hypothetical protein
VDGGRDESQHVEFVGDELSVRKKVASEGSVGVGEVERDPADVFATGDVSERARRTAPSLPSTTSIRRLFLWSTTMVTNRR